MIDDEKEKNTIPDQKELEREIGKYLSDKYGGQVKIISAGLFPQAGPAEDDDDGDRVEESRGPAIDFRIRPDELVAYLDEYVIGQEHAKEVLATKICTHFNRVRQAREEGEEPRGPGQVKSNVLLIGPTGVGKTYLVKLIASRIGVPFVKGDATKFSETGYVGADVEDLIRDLVREAGGDLELASYGIVYVDEIDKIASGRDFRGHDVSRTGVQRALLKPMEETDVDLKVPHDPISQLEAMEYYRTHGKRKRQTVNTRNILFIVSGAFSGLEEIVARRSSPAGIGFESDVRPRKPDPAILSRVKAEDLIEYGFESEFVGRLPVIAVLDDLGEEDLYQILQSPTSAVVVAKKQDFLAYGIRIAFEDEAMRRIAALARAERTGARGLVSVLERVLLPFERRLPSSDIRYLVVSPGLVDSPRETLDRLLSDPDAAAAEEERYHELAAAELARLEEFVSARFSGHLAENGVSPSPGRLRLVAARCQEKNHDPRYVCDKVIALVKEITSALVGAFPDDVEVELSDSGIDALIERSGFREREAVELCRAMGADMGHGIRLLSQKKGMRRLVLDRSAVEDPVGFINELVQKSFSGE